MPEGRRVLVAVVAGEVGARIQAWRERHDPKHATRLPPHVTLCYRPPDAPIELIEAQVRHALPEPIDVRLGAVRELGNREMTLAIHVIDTDTLESARDRLFDGRYVQMGGYRVWPWHITCVRYGQSRDIDVLLADAATELALDTPWAIDVVSYLELRGPRYEPVTEWRLDVNGANLARVGIGRGAAGIGGFE